MVEYLSKSGLIYLWGKIKATFYRKPSGGIPKSDLSSAVQTSLGKADTALQSHQDIYQLVINNSAGTAQVTYKPATSGTYGLTLTKAMVGLGNVANSTYAGGTAVTLNGTSKASSTASFYAPTSAGTSNYVLKSNGSGEPVWSNDYAIKNHLYHPWTVNMNYWEDYYGGNNFRMLTENVLADTLRFQARSLSNIEYWDYTSSSWKTWELSTIGLLFDGNYQTSCIIPYARRKFRFQITSSSSWPTSVMFLLEGTWFDSGSYTKLENNNLINVIIETRANSSNDFAVKSTFGFENSTQGRNARVISTLHNGEPYYRITIEICPWEKTEHPANLRRLCILSNYSGNPLRITRHDENGNVYPISDNVYSLGVSDKRWSTIYGVAGSFSGNITGASFTKSGGTSSQFLKADGSTDSNAYLTSSDLPAAITNTEMDSVLEDNLETNNN